MVRISVDAVTDDEGVVDPVKIDELTETLESEAEADRTAFEPPDDLDDCALAYVKDGVGRVLGLYILLRTGGRTYRFSPDQFDRLEFAMNTWFELYARCYGVDIDAEFSLRTAAELLIETDELLAVAEVLTGVSRDNT